MIIFFFGGVKTTTIILPNFISYPADDKLKKDRPAYVQTAAYNHRFGEGALPLSIDSMK